MQFEVGQYVTLLAEPARVGRVESLDRKMGRLQYYRVFWGGPHPVSIVAGPDLAAYVGGAEKGERVLGGWDDFLRRATYERLRQDRPLRNTIYAFNASRTKFMPHQFKPLLKLLDSPKPRLLIADEVGLGKTIEAGLILTELRARTQVRRVLVVCPASLCEKWRRELHERFGEKEFQRFSTQQLSQWLEDYARDPNLRLNAIMALESIRREPMLEKLEEVAPDLQLAIIDEAHYMRNLGRLSRRVGVLMRSLADSLLLLSATPIHLGQQNLFSLLNILDEDEFPDEQTSLRRFDANEPVVEARRLLGAIPPRWAEAAQQLAQARRDPLFSDNAGAAAASVQLAEILRRDKEPSAAERVELLQQLDDLNLLGHLITRTRKREVQAASVREPVAKLLAFTREERELYDAVTKYTRSRATLQTKDPRVREWIVMTPQRRLASSVPAMVNHYRTKLLSGLDSDPGDDLDFEDDLQGNVTPQTLAAYESSRQQLLKVIVGWNERTADTKLEALLQVLQEPEGRNTKVLVFAFFKATLEYLLKSLTARGFSATIIHGDVDPAERDARIAQFRDDPSLRIMLSSRVGSEGLDFQFCHVLVNYDLPWNPMEVEQRIGRLDRIGQRSSKIRIYNLWVEGTIEEKILRRLYDRLRIFERSIGALEGILGPILSELEGQALSDELTPEQVVELCEQAELRIAQERRNVEGLEADAARLFSMDEVMMESVRRVQEHRRFVTGRQLRRFVEDFLEQHSPSSSLRSLDDTGLLFRLRPGAEVRELIGRMPRDGMPDAHLLTKYMSETASVELTFDGEYAFEHPEVEFLSVLHPLVRMICRQYDQDRTALFRHCVVSLSTRETKLLTPGLYGFQMYLLHVKAARPQDTLEFVLVNEHGDCPLGDQECEQVFGEIAEFGQTPAIYPATERMEAIEAALPRADDHLWERRERRRAHAERTNSMIVDRQRASLDSFFRRRIQIVEERLELAWQAEKKESYCKGLQTRITNLRAEWEGRRAALELQRAVSVSHEPNLLSGILVVRGETAR